MRSFNSISISKRINLVLSLSMLLLLIVLGTFLWNHFLQTNTEMRTYADSMTDTITGLLTDKTETVAKVSSHLAQNSYIEDYFRTDSISEQTEYIQFFNTMASNVINENPDILSVCLLDSKGRTTTVGRLLDSVVLANLQRTYPQILQDAPFEPFFSSAIHLEGRLPYYAYIMPVYDTSHPVPRTRLATCIVLCDLRTVQEVIDQQLTLPFCRIQIYDSRSALFCRRAAELTYTGSFEETIKHTIAPANWTIHYILDFTQFTFNTNSLFILVAIAAICLIMMLAISITIRLSLAKPIDTLLDKLRTSKDLTHIDLHFNNELDIIVDTIEYAVRRLEAASEERLHSETRMYAMQLHLRESELSALQSQINPHFLYNTLECMRSIGLFYNSPEIVTISTAMTDIFRYSIKSSSMVNLEKELEIVRKYLSIINIRFDNRFKIEFDIAPETEALIIPKMTLQPIVENAIYHGLEPRKAAGILTIQSSLKSGCLHLMVRDNGAGMSPEDIESINQRIASPNSIATEDGSKRSIGLTNIARRIDLFSHGSGTISVESKLNDGTTVYVTLPARTNE